MNKIASELRKIAARIVAIEKAEVGDSVLNWDVPMKVIEKRKAGTGCLYTMTYNGEHYEKWVQSNKNSLWDMIGKEPIFEIPED